MNKLLRLSLLIGVLALALAGCGTTPEPTEPPPTQTPWYIVVTATPGPEGVAQVEPTPVVVTVVVTATPTRARKATPTPVEGATPGSEATPTPTTTATQPPAPTNTPPIAPAVLKYPPPVLLDPPNNRPVSWKSTVLLIWSPVGELAEDEYYVVKLERRPQTAGQEWYGDYVYTKETEYLAEGAFLAPFHPPQEQGHGVVYWWVWVARKTGEDEEGKSIGIDLSPPSEERTLILDPKPEGE